MPSPFAMENWVEVNFKALVAYDLSWGVLFEAWYEAVILTLYPPFNASTDLNDINQPKWEKVALHIASLA